MDFAAYFLAVVRSEIPAAKGETTSFLLDHLPQVLETMGEFISNGGNAVVTRRCVDFSKAHAEERLTGRMYTAAQIAKEYAIVREAILALLGPHVVLDIAAVRLFSAVCELTLATVIETFVRREMMAPTNN